MESMIGNMSPEERDLFPEIVQLLADVDAALALPGGVASFATSDETVWAAVIVARAHDLIRGTRACIDAAQSMSALVLQRPLFEDSVLLTRAAAVDGSSPRSWCVKTSPVIPWLDSRRSARLRSSVWSPLRPVACR